jgi:HEAT repeat protein
VGVEQTHENAAMKHRTLFVMIAVGTLIAPRIASADDDTVQTIIKLVSDKDKDVRAIGLEQVRDEAKGAEATRRFAALLPKLAPDAQVGLLGALAGRGDAAAKPAVLELLKSSQGEVRSAAIRALGPLANRSEVPQLVGLLADENSQKDAAAALTLMHGDGVNAVLCGQLKTTAPTVRVSLVKLLVARHAIDSVPSLLAASKGSDPKVRAAALDALGQLGGPELIAKLAREILDAKDDKSREEAEISLALIARRDPKNHDPALPLLDAMQPMNNGEKRALLPALGRIGGKSALRLVKVAMLYPDAACNAAATKALCNWPDGSVAPLLLERALASKVPAERKTLIDALIRVAPIPDGRTDAERLSTLKKAMELCSSEAERSTVIKRARAIRSLDTLRFVAPYMEQPQFAEIACETVVELAHHKELRQPNKAEFDKALDKVILLSKDPEVILRAKHYLKDETWVEKQIKGK